MDRRISTNKFKSKNKNIFTSWIFWTLFFTIIMMVVYGIVENSLQKKPPSENWSLASKSLENIPNDFRKIDYTYQKDNKGIALAYVIDEGIQLKEIDYMGKVKRSFDIFMDSSNIKLINIESLDNKYNIYISDRKILDRITVEIENLNIIKKKRISDHSEQFDTMGNSIIVGDDIKTDIIIDDKIVATYDNYEDLKKVKIKTHEGKVYASMDTIQGGDIIVVNGKEVIRKNITNAINQEEYGYISDLYVKDDSVTVLSHYFNPTEPVPTLIGAWQLDSNNLEENNFWLWNHPRTTLEPKIVDVTGEEISYVLGIQQRIDENKESVLKFPIEQSGMFTNLSLYRREKSSLIDYTRLTNTVEYPLGYEYINLDQGDIIIWIDKMDSGSSLMLAGKNEPWIELIRENYQVDYLGIIKKTIMMFITTPIWGAIFFILDLASHWKLILLFVLILLAYDKLMSNKEKEKGLLLGIIIFTIGFKLYITAISNGQLKQYIDIYPGLFGNNTLLGIISIVTSILSIFIYSLWYRNNNDASRLIKSSIFLGIETYFYFFSILVYLQSAMLKIEYMV